MIVISVSLISITLIADTIPYSNKGDDGSKSASEITEIAVNRTTRKDMSQSKANKMKDKDIKQKSNDLPTVGTYKALQSQNVMMKSFDTFKEPLKVTPNVNFLKLQLHRRSSERYFTHIYIA